VREVMCACMRIENPDNTGGLGGHSRGRKAKKGVNSGVPKLQYGTRVSMTYNKGPARELHELAQYLLRENPHQRKAEMEPNTHSLGSLGN
jgi:hypothetical protein